MGEQLGLSNQFDPSSAGTLMSVFLADGERTLPSSTDVAQANATVVVPAWTDHLSQGPDDNFDFAPPSAAAATAVPAIGGAPTPVASPGVTAPAGDSFQGANTDAHTALGSTFTLGSSSNIDPGLAAIGDAFHWPPATAPAPDTHMAVVDTTLHDAVLAPVAAILPDAHALAATIPSLGGFIIH
jgi:hypothetical protein